MDTITNLDGGVGFWRLSKKYRLDALQAGFSALGIDAFCPAKRSDLTILRDALEAMFPKMDIRSQRKQRGSGFDVIPREREEHDLKYDVVFWAKVGNPNDPNLLYELSDPARSAELYEHYLKEMAYTSLEEVSKKLVQFARAIKGVALREQGGIYWIPSENFPIWNHVGQIITRAAMGTSRLYMIKHKLDAESTIAVVDAINDEVEAEVREIERYITEGYSNGKPLGQRAMDGQLEKSDALVRRIEFFESKLSVSLEQAKKLARSVRETRDIATVIAAAAGSDEDFTAPAVGSEELSMVLAN